MKSLMLSLMLFIVYAFPVRATDNKYRHAALQAARWIKSSAIKMEQGMAWPSDPRDTKTVATNLYSGTPGIILFLLEAYRATGDRAYLDDARAGADYLLADLPNQKGSGLYTGIAGSGFVLQETYKVTRHTKYRQGSLRCAQLISDRAIKSGKGIEWSDTTDIIGGGAGIGLFLLYAAKELNQPSFRELAVKAAHRLIELGRPEAEGVKWAMDSKFPRLMPNFSHGTAGIAYFLATLYGETKEKEFLEAALSGAKYLQSVAATDGNICLIFHNEPEGKELYYLGWCHGPVGTARLFFRLYKTTGDRAWMDWVEKSARAVMESGIPEKQAPGFWNNVSQCCGSAGVAEFFLDLHRVTGKRNYLDFSKRMTANLLTRATSDDGGMKWIQAEHRVRPELLVAQTGYMQGAAGIGMLLLHLDGYERGKKERITFPDSPF